MNTLGIDIGTSGVRACVIDSQGEILAMHSAPMPAPEVSVDSISQAPQIWWHSVQSVLHALFEQVDVKTIQAICVDGTSGTVLMTDAEGTPLGDALMYNDSHCVEQAATLAKWAPRNSAAHGASAGLAKLLCLYQQYPQAVHALHQADWIAGQFSGRWDISDANNALKSGYDVLQQCWPDWLQQLDFNTALLPKVVAPGSAIGNVGRPCVEQFGFNEHTQVVTGTTDSIAAFIATGADQPGMAVTSLGSTLAIKIICEQPVYAPAFGIYSHRLGNYWLAGGASNTGGAVLRQFFTDQQLHQLTPQLTPEQDTGLDYYPLTRPGERFPINDAKLQPRLAPRPENNALFLQGLLESIGRIEKQAYDKLHELGAPMPVSVASAGGGANNPAWLTMRQRLLGVAVFKATQSDACYGSALLALNALRPTQ